MCTCLLLLCCLWYCVLSFFFTATAPTEIYTLSLHDALPISIGDVEVGGRLVGRDPVRVALGLEVADGDRKSTRLNSSHRCISYAVFCLKNTSQHHCPWRRATAQSIQRD